MTPNDDTLRKVQQLEAENQKLRSQVSQLQGNGNKKPTQTYVDMWKGNPVLRFDGNFRPFGIGLKKASIILECLNDVKAFVENNKARLEHAAVDDDHAS